MFRLLICVLGLLCCFVQSQAWAGPPNILFIAIDDQNDWIGCLGGIRWSRLRTSTSWHPGAHCSPTLTVRLRCVIHRERA